MICWGLELARALETGGPLTAEIEWAEVLESILRSVGRPMTGITSIVVPCSRSR